MRLTNEKIDTNSWITFDYITWNCSGLNQYNEDNKWSNSDRKSELAGPGTELLNDNFSYLRIERAEMIKYLFGVNFLFKERHL